MYVTASLELENHNWTNSFDNYQRWRKEIV